MTAPPKSSYEKDVYLEAWIARIVAWLLYLGAVVVLVLWIIGVLPISWWQTLVAEFVIWTCAGWSAKCEYDAEKQLRTIWDTQMTERMVHGD